MSDTIYNTPMDHYTDYDGITHSRPLAESDIVYPPLVAESRKRLADELRAMRPMQCNCYYWTLTIHQCKARYGQKV